MFIQLRNFDHETTETNKFSIYLASKEVLYFLKIKNGLNSKIHNKIILNYKNITMPKKNLNWIFFKPPKITTMSLKIKLV
jgi:hypothetical protein